MEHVRQMRDQMASVIDLEFFMIDANVNTQVDNDQLAEAIRGASYERTAKRIGEFRARCEQQLETAMQRVKQVEAEYDSLVAKADANNPGKPPSDIWVTKSDPNSVNKFNEKVDRYNNKLDLYRRICDQAERAKERLQDAVAVFEDKKADLEQQIQDRRQELIPALDQDIVATVGKLHKVCSGSANGGGPMFSAFLTSFMAKKTADFLLERVDAVDHRRTADEIVKEIDGVLDNCVSKGGSEIMDGFREAATFLKLRLDNNAEVLSHIKEELSNLPNDVCKDATQKAEQLLQTNREISLDYQSIVDPAELAGVEKKIQETKSLIQNDIAAIEGLIKEMEPVWDSVTGTRVIVDEELNKMHEYKRTEIDPLLYDVSFVLSPLDPSQRDRYFPGQAGWFEDAQKELDKGIGRPLNDLISEITNTELLTRTASDIINQNPAFGFVSYRDELNKKREELKKSIEGLDSALAEIGEIPRQLSEELGKKMSIMLGFSLIPVGNVISAFSIMGLLKKFLPALSGTNPCFVEIRPKLAKRLQTFSYVHVLLTVVAGVLSFLLEQRLQPILWACAGSYLISLIILFLKASTVNRLEESSAVAEDK